MKHQVQVTGIAGSRAPAEVAPALARLFHISEARAGQLLAHLPLVIKDGLDAETAGKYRHHLQAIGLEVSVHAVMTLAEELVLAVSGEPPGPAGKP